MNNKELNFLHPVGSVYETSDTTFMPSLAWGGTWEKDETGTVAVAKSDSGTFNLTTGNVIGESESVCDMPAHNHTSTLRSLCIGTGSTASWGNFQGNSRVWGMYNNATKYFEAYGASEMYTNYVGSGTKHNNMQKFTVTVRWVRTS